MKNYKNVFKILTIFFISLTMLFTACKEKNEDTDTNTESSQYVLVIENGAQSISPDGTMNYTAYLIDTDGNITEPNSVEWSVNDTKIASITTAGVITAVGTGSISVTATVTIGDKTYTASVPLGIYAPPTIFAVAPSAVIGMKGDVHQLNTVFLSIGSEPSYTFSTSNTGVATVDNSGKLTLTGTGLCSITVTASTMQNAPFIIPVSVIEMPEIILPIARVELTPASAEKFKGETAQFSAKAYNTANEEISSTFEWTTTDNNIATVDANGLVTTKAIGKTTVFALTKGIFGQAEIIVRPDTIVVVEPFWADIAAGKTQQFTAKAYNARTGTQYADVVDFTWTIPTYGFAMFDVATVDANGLVSVKNNAVAGMMTFILANVTGKEETMGGAGLMVAVTIADDCDCGEGDPQIVSITVPESSVNLSFGGMSNVNAIALDILGSEVVGAELVYCSDNLMICSVDFDGNLIALAAGNATIKICSGTVNTTVNVTATGTSATLGAVTLDADSING